MRPTWLAACLAGTTLALTAGTQPAAVKLWPQITPGIYNDANVLVMKCRVAEDGLTVTDAAWDTYKVEGCGKRWTLNMGSPMKEPLKRFKFSPEFSGRYSQQLADYSDWRVNEPMTKRTINGTQLALNYYLKYFGFYNFHVLGMWQASQNRDIIEAKTAWEMPEIRTSTGNVWRVGDERFPSYVNFYKEPLVRTKVSEDGKTLLVLACNPHNQGVQQARIRRPGRVEEYGFELVGDFPIIKRFPITTR